MPSRTNVMADTSTNPAPVDPDAGIPTSEATFAGVIHLDGPAQAGPAPDRTPCPTCKGVEGLNWECELCAGRGSFFGDKPQALDSYDNQTRRRETALLAQVTQTCEYPGHRRIPGIPTSSGPVPVYQCLSCLLHAGESWGAGPVADRLPASGRVKLGDVEVDLIDGDHPHSRRLGNHDYVRLPSGSIEGFEGHRVCWGLVIETHNYLKTSYLSGNEVRKGGSIKLTADGVVVAEEFCREFDLDAAKRLYETVQRSLGNGMPAYWTPKGREELDNGKLIFFRGFPGRTRHVMPDQGALILVPEPGFSFPGYPRSPFEPSGEIKWTIFSEEINWYRKPDHLLYNIEKPITRERIIQLMFPETETITGPRE